MYRSYNVLAPEHYDVNRYYPKTQLILQNPIPNLLQDALLGDLGWQVIWGLCRAASRGAPGRRTSGAKRKYSEIPPAFV